VKVCRLHVQAVWRTTPSVTGSCRWKYVHITARYENWHQFQTLGRSYGWNYVMLKSYDSLSPTVVLLRVSYMLRYVYVEVFFTISTTWQTLRFSHKRKYVSAEGISWLTPSVRQCEELRPMWMTHTQLKNDKLSHIQFLEVRLTLSRFFAHVQTGPGVHPASCTMGTGSFPGVKRPGRGADHPPPSSAEVRKE
jgi:hypothetical protein